MTTNAKQGALVIVTTAEALKDRETVHAAVVVKVDQITGAANLRVFSTQGTNDYTIAGVPNVADKPDPWVAYWEAMS